MITLIHSRIFNFRHCRGILVIRIHYVCVGGCVFMYMIMYNYAVLLRKYGNSDRLLKYRSLLSNSM